MRFLSDCTDTASIGRWALQAVSTKVALFGFFVYAVFLNLATFGMVVESGALDSLDLKKLRAALSDVRKKGWGLHRGGSLAGHSMQISVLIKDFGRLKHSKAFDAMVGLLDAGINSFTDFDHFMIQLGKARKGLLGTYHGKNLMDVLVYMKWLPAKWIKYYMVANIGGTKLGLLRIFKKPKACGEKTLSQMLNELLHRLRADGFKADNQATVGMSLCWLKRLQTKAARSCLDNRLEEARVVWNEQMDKLREAEIVVPGF